MNKEANLTNNTFEFILTWNVDEIPDSSSLLVTLRIVEVGAVATSPAGLLDLDCLTSGFRFYEERKINSSSFKPVLVFLYRQM